VNEACEAKWTDGAVPRGHGLAPGCPVTVRGVFVATVPATRGEPDPLQRQAVVELAGGQRVVLRVGDLQAVAEQEA